MSGVLLRCVDLDRTLLPNGSDPESPEARPRFAAVAARPEVRLACVTGRDLGRVEPVTVGPWLLACGEALAGRGVRCRLVHSVDPIVGRGLLDVIPEGAGKAPAIAFLMGALGLPAEQVVFAGDSANDLDVLTSELPAVLVANASGEVRRAAEQGAQAAGRRHRLHVAKGGFFGMNGCYSAGVLEGVAHYHPETIPWMTTAAEGEASSSSVERGGDET